MSSSACPSPTATPGTSLHFELRCRECGKRTPNAARSFCEECFSPVEVVYDLDRVRRTFTPEQIAQRPTNMWRYSELLPVPEGYKSTLPTGFTPLVTARKLGAKLGLNHLYVKNDAVCFPTLSFKDRVVSTAIAAAKRFGLETIGCSSTGNLANAVAAQAAREGLKAWVFIPEDLEPAKILSTRVYGANVVKIRGN
jgi:threonine synthase